MVNFSKSVCFRTRFFWGHYLYIGIKNCTKTANCICLEFSENSIDIGNYSDIIKP